MDLLRKVLADHRSGLTPAEIAAKIGVSERWVLDLLSANALELLE